MKSGWGAPTSLAIRQGLAMTKADNGVWEVTVGPLPPGSYRYNFNVNGVSVIDPRSPAISESNNNVWSLFHVPGADFMDTKDVPHGAVAMRHLPLDGAAQGSPDARLHAAGVRAGHRQVPRASICSTAPATPTTRGPRSAARASSWTT